MAARLLSAASPPSRVLVPTLLLFTHARLTGCLVHDGLPSPPLPASTCSPNPAKPVGGRASNNGSFALLTSFVIPTSKNEHSDEIFASLVANLANPFISEAHVLTEGDACHRLAEMLGTKTLLDTSIDEGKLHCVPCQRQPTYWDFFRYAATVMEGSFVLLANADTVFDSSLSLVDQQYLEGGKHGFVLSVSSPTRQSLYFHTFHQECNSTDRCTVWRDGGFSWDAYVFQSVPEVLLRMNSGALGVPMNMLGAENTAGFQLRVVARMQLSNPCLHVKLSHFHCLGTKMHLSEERLHADDFLSRVIPCWDCEGVRLPAHRQRTSELCASGHASQIRLRTLQQVFGPLHADMRLCCRSMICDEEHLLALYREGSLDLCRSAEDIGCVMQMRRRGSAVYRKPRGLRQQRRKTDAPLKGTAGHQAAGSLNRVLGALP